MKFWTILLIVIVLALAVGGCTTSLGPAQPAATGDQPTATPEPLPSPTEPAAATDTVAPTDAPPVENEPPAGAPASASDEVDKALSEKLAVDPEQMTVVSMEAVQWPDSCLGVNTMEIMCAEVITPGYVVVVEMDGEQITLHTNEDLSVVRVAETETPSGAGAQGAAVFWQSPDEPCIGVQIDATFVRFGPCGSQDLQSDVLDESTASELATFLALYAPYSAETASGTVALMGKGPARAEASDQRALAEWASAVVAAAAENRSTPGAGLAMSWQREGGIAGFCDSLAVSATGLAEPVSCQTSPPSDLGTRWLSSQQTALLFAWIDGTASFQYEQKDPAVADAMTVGLVFKGDGAAEVTEAGRQAMLDFAGQVFTFGAQATETRYVLADGDVPMLSGPGETFPQVGEVFGGQTAFVTGVSQDGRWWRVICPDDTVGDCWLAADKVTPQAAPPAVAPASYDPAEIYATIIRQVYTVDHTFGQPPNFPRVYLVSRTDDSVGAPGSPASSQALAPSDQERITAALTDLPADFIWVASADAAPRDANGAVAEGGAIITVGNIAPQPDGTLHVPASIYIAMLAAGGQTYVLENGADGWQITGTTGPIWIS